MIDSHCHLDHDTLLCDLPNIIKRSKEIGIKKLLTISTNFESFTKIKEIVKSDEIIFGTFGIHPHETKDNIITSETIIRNIKENKKIIGIGETGLDFYYNNSDKNSQIKSFEQHIEASIKTNLPIIIHSRDAEDETYRILKKYRDKNLKILMHCFTGSKAFSEKLISLNSYFSASGIITFKNSKDLQETFSNIPLDRLLIETDSPFLAPVPNRGKKNEPSFIKFTAEKLAEIMNIPLPKLITITSNNFDKLFLN